MSCLMRWNLSWGQEKGVMQWKQVVQPILTQDLTSIREDSNSPFPHPHFMQAVRSVLCIVSFARKIKSISCSTITEPKARRSIPRRSGRCFVCLKAGHITPGCQSKVKCINCGAGHHAAICENSQKPAHSSSSGAELTSLSKSETSQERSRDVGTSTMHVGSNNNSVLSVSYTHLTLPTIYSV